MAVAVQMKATFLLMITIRNQNIIIFCARLWAGQGSVDGVTTATRYHSSADSLLIGHGSWNSADTVEGVDDCFVMQCNQIFVGMITMQYQAKQVGMPHS